MMPKYFEFICPVKILCGRKALANLPFELSQAGAKKCLIITDQGVKNAGLLNHIKEAMADGECEIGAIFDETPMDSSNRVVNRIAVIYRDKKCDSLVAVGGGSVIDTAKGVNIVVSENSDDLLKFQGVERLKAQMKPFIAIPTTAGTGSEVTSAAVIYNEETGVKMEFISTKLFPSVAILDPIMTLTLPPKMTAASGMDALTHAIEAYYSLQKNPISDAFVVSAIKLINENLLKSVKNGNDEEARLGMALAALLAGIGFSNAMVGIVHSLAHACGSVAKIPHGIGNAIFLPYGLEYNIEKTSSSRIIKQIAEIAPLLGVKAEGLEIKEQAYKVVEYVRNLNIELNKLCQFPITIKEFGVKEEQLEKIAKVAANDGVLTYNPVEANYADLLEILKKAFYSK